MAEIYGNYAKQGGKTVRSFVAIGEYDPQYRFTSCIFCPIRVE